MQSFVKLKKKLFTIQMNSHLIESNSFISLFSYFVIHSFNFYKLIFFSSNLR